MPKRYTFNWKVLEDIRMVSEEKMIEAMVLVHKEGDLVFIDTREYEGKKFDIPESRVVSPVWVAKKLVKHIQNKS